jgi:predicted DNA-binding WGR domain protein
MMTLLKRINPTENMNRWYLVSVQATLFSSCEVVIAWGRRDTDFQQWRTLLAKSPDNAEQIAAKIIQRKLRRGYQVCEQSFPMSIKA